jgi:DNA-binding winged helix-turn-helix (wHTH) protein/TolB-like protein/tetratricopeptide (TPR) repeat protein
MSSAISQLRRFGNFRLDVQRKVLRFGNEPVDLPLKEIELLCVLTESNGELVTKAEILDRVWADSFVEESNLSRHVYLLRKTFKDLGEGEDWIQTVARRGYRFAAEVQTIDDETLVIERHQLTRTLVEEMPAEFEGGGTKHATKPAESSLRGVAWRLRVRSALFATIAVVAVLGGYVYYARTRTEGRSVAGIRSVAVLPFKTIAAGQENSHQGLGFADVLITRLSNIKELNVRPTSAVMGFENSESDSVTVGRQLQVDAILEGSIYYVNDRVRVTARLVRVSDQSPIWASQFEGVTQDELKLQDEIALQVVDALAITLSGHEKIALTKRFSESPEAFQLYIRGRYHWNKRNYEGLVEAQRLFRNALEKDPKFALAYVGLADSMAFSYETAQIYSALTKALEIDPNLAEAHATRGFYATVHGWDWQTGEASFRKSIELNPGYATAHHWYAILLGIEGRNDEAKAELRRALEIDPLSYNFLADLGQVHYFAGEYDQAKEYCKRALTLYPEFPYAHNYLWAIYLKTGEYDSAIEEVIRSQSALFTSAAKSAKEKESQMKYYAAQRERYRRVGIREYLLESAQQTRSGTDPSVHYGRAQIYAFLGEKETALDNLEKAHADRAFLMPWLKADPAFDNLRSEPRYQEILKKMGL